MAVTVNERGYVVKGNRKNRPEAKWVYQFRSKAIADGRGLPLKIFHLLRLIEVMTQQ